VDQERVIFITHRKVDLAFVLHAVINLNVGEWSVKWLVREFASGPQSIGNIYLVLEVSFEAI
jgi:hypothetical protein